MISVTCCLSKSGDLIPFFGSGRHDNYNNRYSRNSQETKSRTNVVETLLDNVAAEKAGDERGQADRVAELDGTREL